MEIITLKNQTDFDNKTDCNDNNIDSLKILMDFIKIRPKQAMMTVSGISQIGFKQQIGLLTDPLFPQTGGVAYVGSWSDGTNSYTRCVVWTTNGTITLPSTSTIYLWLVGGGGSGGGSLGTAFQNPSGAGGGAGRVIHGTIELTGGVNYSVTVGAGGAGSVSTKANGGQSRLFGTGVDEQAFGGGAAGVPGALAQARGENGGSGGGSYRGTEADVLGGTALTGGTFSTNTRNLTYLGFGGGSGNFVQGGGGGGGAAGPGGAGGAGGAFGGGGVLIPVSGTPNPFIGPRYAAGGCAGSRGGSTVNQSSAIALGSAAGGFLGKPVPLAPTTRGSGGGGAHGQLSTSYSGGPGTSGICIIFCNSV